MRFIVSALKSFSLAWAGRGRGHQMSFLGGGMAWPGASGNLFPVGFSTLAVCRAPANGGCTLRPPFGSRLVQDGSKTMFGFACGTAAPHRFESQGQAPSLVGAGIVACRHGHPETEEFIEASASSRRVGAPARKCRRRRLQAQAPQNTGNH